MDDSLKANELDYNAKQSAECSSVLDDAQRMLSKFRGVFLRRPVDRKRSVDGIERFASVEVGEANKHVEDS